MIKWYNDALTYVYAVMIMAIIGFIASAYAMFPY